MLLWSPPATTSTGLSCSDPGAVLINELMPDPSGSDGGNEWIELINVCGGDVDLSGWKVYTATSGTPSLKHTFATGTILTADSFFLLGDAGYTSTADALSSKTLSLGNAASNADIVQLKNSSSTIIDVVIYGTPNADSWTDETGAVVSNPAPTPTTGSSLSRTVDGDNDGDDGDDFCADSNSTPGAPNNPNCVLDTPCDGVGVDDTGCTTDTSSDSAPDSAPDSPKDSAVDSAVDSPPPANDCSAYAGLVINEFVYDLDGSEDGYEWVELYNGSANTLDLSAVTFHAAKSSWSAGTTLSGTLAPGELLLVGESLVPDVDLLVNIDLGNATSSADGVQIRCGDAPLDTVIYGSSNSEALEDDLTWGMGAGATSLAPKVPSNSGQSLARVVNGQDTDLSADDFAVAATTTPGALNDEPAPCVTLGVEGLRINELLVSSAETGDEASWEWLELVNTGSDPVSLAGWVVQAVGSSFSPTSTDVYTFGDEVLVLPGEYLVLAGPNVLIDGAALQGTVVRYTEDDYTHLSFGNASSTADGVQLRDCDGEVVDTVIYASSADKNTEGLLCDNDDPLDVAPLPGDDESLGRSPDGDDTDVCVEDWQVFSADEGMDPSPGYANAEPLPCSILGADGLRINELLIDSEGEGGDDYWEWIELYNGSADSVDLTGWTLHIAGQQFDLDPDYTFPSGALAPGQFLLLAGPSVAVTEAGVAGVLQRFEVDAWPGLGNASSTADGLQLRDCEGTLIDTVVYGDAGTNTELLLCDNENADDIALLPDTDESLGRLPDGADSDSCSVDWRIYGSADGLLSTPGQPNDIPPECVLTGRDGVKLNELLSNPGANASYGSEDDDREWIEIVNSSSEEVNLGGWSLEVASSAFESVVAFGETVVLAPGAFLVVHGPAFEGELVEGAVYVEVAEGELSLGNASSSDDGVRLLDCEAAEVDTVLYGPADSIATLPGAGAGTLAPSALENASIGRYPDGEDSDDHAADWLSFPVPSPGEANPELKGGGGGGKVGGCGSRNQDQAGDYEQPGRCSTQPLPNTPLPGVWILIGALIVIRRRP